MKIGSLAKGLADEATKSVMCGHVDCTLNHVKITSVQTQLCVYTQLVSLVSAQRALKWSQKSFVMLYHEQWYVSWTRTIICESRLCSPTEISFSY